MKKKIKKVLLKVTPNFVYKAYKNKKDNKKEVRGIITEELLDEIDGTE